MRRTRMMTAAMMLAMGTTAGLASAQDAAAIIAEESKHVQGIDAPAEVTMPDLMPGDKAPELKIASWVKGTPVSEFEKGTAYMVDFWATWCGPCIAAMPHMTELQEKYNDENFRLIGVSIWERPEGDALVEHVSNWVEKNDEKMGYTVAIDDNGAMAESWMKASGQQGIPTAMLVDREGEIAWIGYGNDPALDGALEQVINGTWDTDQARADRVETIKQDATQDIQRAWYGRFMQLANEGEQDRAATLAGALLEEGVVNIPMALNGMAWRMVENEGWSDESVAVARDLALAAVESAGDNAAILDTLAWSYYRLGEYDKAIETQTKAIDNASGDMKTELMESLETFKARGG